MLDSVPTSTQPEQRHQQQHRNAGVGRTDPRPPSTDRHHPKTADDKLSTDPRKEALLGLIADIFEKQSRNSNLPDKNKLLTRVTEYLQRNNSCYNPEQAIKSAFHAEGLQKFTPPQGQTIKDIAQIITNKHFDSVSTPNIFPAIKKLTQEAEQRNRDPTLRGKHILLLGEHHNAIEHKNGKQDHPASEWLLKHLDDFKRAGYDTLALEAPNDIPVENYLLKGYESYTSNAYPQLVYEEGYQLTRLLESKGYGKNPGAKKFIDLLNHYIKNVNQQIKAGQTVKTSKTIQSRRINNARKRWLELAQEASTKGFNIILTDMDNIDAKKKNTETSKKYNSRWRVLKYPLLGLILKEAKKCYPNSQGLEFIEGYLKYRCAQMTRVRDLMIAANLEQALRESKGNVLGLYGANHLTDDEYHGFKGTYQILHKQRKPVTSILLEYPGMEPDCNTSRHFLIPRIKPDTFDRPRMLEITNSPLLDDHRHYSKTHFEQDKLGIHRAQTIPAPAQKERPSFDAVIYFPYTPAATAA